MQIASNDQNQTNQQHPSRFDLNNPYTWYTEKRNINARLFQWV